MKNNYVAKNMHKTTRPSVHRDRTVYNRKNVDLCASTLDDEENDYFDVVDRGTLVYDVCDSECCDIGTSNLNVE